MSDTESTSAPTTSPTASSSSSSSSWQQEQSTTPAPVPQSTNSAPTTPATQPDRRIQTRSATQNASSAQEPPAQGPPAQGAPVQGAPAQAPSTQAPPPPPPPPPQPQPVIFLPNYIPKGQRTVATNHRTATRRTEEQNGNSPHERNHHTTTGRPEEQRKNPLYEQYEQKRSSLYETLGILDPYRATPKEFIHLLVKAAMRDNEISKAIFRMNEDRQRNPGYWQPVPPIPASMRPGQPNWQQTPQSVMNRHVPASVPEHPLPTVIYYPPNDPPITPQAKPPANHGPAQSKTGPSAVGAPPGQSKSPAAPSNMGQRPIPSMAGGADTNGIVTEHSDEPKEQSCNFTWVLDRAETHLGWTGNYDKFSEIRQISTGYNVAFKLQKLLKKMDAMVEKYVTFPNRVHILTVMREVMMATLETDSVVGRECRECSREYDSTFLASVQRLTPTQKQKLKVLEGGRWMEEFKALIDEANRQAMFPLLERANAVIDG